MKLIDCPEWKNDDNSALPDIASAGFSFFKFMERQNPKRYVLNHGDLKAWHKKLFENCVPVHYYAGNYRQNDPNKPCLQENVGVAGIPGAHFDEVDDQMRHFSDDLAKNTLSTDQFLGAEVSPVTRVKAAAQLAAFAGGTIIRIHPFLNGNGRIARLAMNFFLHRYLDKIPFFIDRPKNPNYSIASRIAMESGNFVPLYQYLVELLAIDYLPK